MKKGFTLVELSIVLVIIGLLIGGILSAQSMVQTAKVNRQIQQIKQIEIAIRNFRTSFNSFPGDSGAIGTASGGVYPGPSVTSGGQASVICAGNNDGMVGANFTASPNGNETWAQTDPYYCHNYQQEWARVFEHLGASGHFKWELYDDSTSNSWRVGIAYPQMALDVADPSVSTSAYSAYGGLVFGWLPNVSYIPAGNKIVLGACPYAGVNFSCAPNQKYAQALDSKLDDGKPYSGLVYIISPIYPLRVYGGLVQDETGGCGNPADNTYRLNLAASPCPVTLDVND